jgi:MerR family transcriptional regulator, heat shock protein HspR
MPDAGLLHQTEDPLISIGVLAEQVGLSVSAVRKYENEGLILAHRTSSGRRLFSHEDIVRVRNIRHMIRDLGLNIAGIRRMQALLPCWELLPCSTEIQEQCPAYRNTTQPCWTIKGLRCASQGNACRQCLVYCFGSLCTEQTKSLVYRQPDSSGATTAARELMDRKGRA